LLAVPFLFLPVELMMRLRQNRATLLSGFWRLIVADRGSLGVATVGAWHADRWRFRARGQSATVAVVRENRSKKKQKKKKKKQKKKKKRKKKKKKKKKNTQQTKTTLQA